MKELICIVCPKGCRLKVEEHSLAVTGNACTRGAVYAREELTHPLRVLTSTVRLAGGRHPRLPVKTDRAIPKELLFQAMELVNALKVRAPVQTGQVLIENLLDTGANLVATRESGIQ